MIRQLHDASFVRRKVRSLIELAGSVREWLRTEEGRIPPDLVEGDDERLTDGEVEGSVADLRSLDEDETLWNPEEEFLPHDAKAAIMQYALDEVWRRSNSVLQDGDPENPYGELLDADEPLAEEARGSIRTKAAAFFYYLYAKGSTKRLPPLNFELH